MAGARRTNRRADGGAQGGLNALGAGLLTPPVWGRLGLDVAQSGDRPQR